jgi:hypothetical protein
MSLTRSATVPDSKSTPAPNPRMKERRSGSKKGVGSRLSCACTREGLVSTESGVHL